MPPPPRTDGLRTTKTVDDVEHTYIYAGGKLIRETYGDTVMDFLYDASGRPYAFYHNGTLYYYVLNLQGDVVRIINENGSAKCTYRYDAWGRIISGPSSGVGVDNPLRYRGYYYDTETGFYYLQSRYYDPAICRFINADQFASTGQGMLGYNMFAYCNNNPVNFEDGSGVSPRPTTVAVSDCESINMAMVHELLLNIERNEKREAVADAFSELFSLRSTGDPTKVLEADFFAIYKGVLVIWIPNSKDAFSFGCIIMGAGIKDNESFAVETLCHEYGHAVHLSQIGVWDYAGKVALPSVIGYWSDVDYSLYFSLPWEYIADTLGDVKRTDSAGSPYQYMQGADVIAKAYDWFIRLS